MAKIMLVEDDNNLREIYAARLQAEGHDIVAARDGEEALALAVKEKPDLILSDVMMPRISGFDMLDILRNAPETKDTKVIMMTALSQAEDKARADKLGADRYLVKSQVTLEDVANVVRDVLEGKPEVKGPAPADTTAAILAPLGISGDAAAVPAVTPITTTVSPLAVAVDPSAPVSASPDPAADASVVNPADEIASILGDTSSPASAPADDATPTVVSPPDPITVDMPSTPVVPDVQESDASTTPEGVPSVPETTAEPAAENVVETPAATETTAPPTEDAATTESSDSSPNSARKVIQPMVDPNATATPAKPDINKLLEEEERKSAAEAAPTPVVPAPEQSSEPNSVNNISL